MTVSWVHYLLSEGLLVASDLAAVPEATSATSLVLAFVLVPSWAYIVVVPVDC